MTDETPYLIVHKVRGKPAFDIAIQMQVVPDEESWWIIPTSGHRAYPFWHTSLEGVLKGDLCVSLTDSWLAHKLVNMPEGHPDHYSANDGGFDDPSRLDTLLNLIRPAMKPAPNLIRRSL